MPIMDASVFVAILHANDVHHPQSLAWYQTAQANAENIIAPAILLAEVGGAVSRNLGNILANQAVQNLAASQIVRLISVSPALAQRAGEIAADYKIKGCDAIYLALAEHLQDELVTLDREQLQRGAAVVTTRPP